LIFCGRSTIDKFCAVCGVGEAVVGGVTLVVAVVVLFALLSEVQPASKSAASTETASAVKVYLDDFIIPSE
jgi:hypothetical protein